MSNIYISKSNDLAYIALISKISKDRDLETKLSQSFVNNIKDELKDLLIEELISYLYNHNKTYINQDLLKGNN